MAHKEHIRPALTFIGSKYRKLDKIFELLNLRNDSVFLDMFGGSGIVGVNVKHHFNCHTIINDYDKIFPLSNNYAIRNQMSYMGQMDKSFTKARLEAFITKIQNGWWDKLELYRAKAKECDIWHYDWTQKTPTQFQRMVQKHQITHIYADPPYMNIQGLYKESFTRKDYDHMVALLNSVRDDVKILVSTLEWPYDDWHITYEPYTYTHGTETKQTHEMFVMNYKPQQQELNLFEAEERKKADATQS